MGMSVLPSAILVIGGIVRYQTARFDIEVDEERAREIVHGLYADYVARRGLFRYVNREVDAPQRRFIPKGMKPGSEAHQRWLSFAVMTDRREQSELVYMAHASLAVTAPRLYTRSVVKMDPEDIADLINQVEEGKIGAPGQSASYWPRYAKTLFDDFGGKPLSIYQLGRGLIDDVLKFKRGPNGDRLPGFGPKILSLFALFLHELSLMEMPPDAFPVDVHVQRFAISTGIITGTGEIINEEVEQILRPLLCRVVQSLDIPALEVSHAIWFLGNRCCSGCYRNPAVPILCSAYEQCGGAISSLSYFKRGRWDLGASRHRKGGERPLIQLEDSPLFGPADVVST